MELGIKERANLQDERLESRERGEKWFNEHVKGLREVYNRGIYVAIYECKVMESAKSIGRLNSRIRKRHENYEDFYIREIR